MTAQEGWGMFLFSLIAFATLAFVAWCILQEVMREQKDRDENNR